MYKEYCNKKKNILEENIWTIVRLKYMEWIFIQIIQKWRPKALYKKYSEKKFGIVYEKALGDIKEWIHTSMPTKNAKNSTHQPMVSLQGLSIHRSCRV